MKAKQSADKLDISSIRESYLCHSCGACQAACAHKSITFRETSGGYIFPFIDYDTCMRCELCYKVCPGLHFGSLLSQELPQNPFKGTIKGSFLGKATNPIFFRNSQSGGVATALIAHLLGNKQISAAILTTMEELPPPRPKAVIVKSVSELEATQKSKYTPVPLLSAIQSLPKDDMPIAIVGLPCHIHGLYNLTELLPKLQKKRFIKIGLICDRVMTAKAINYLGQKASAEPIRSIVFRDKNKPAYPSYPGNVAIRTIKNRDYVLDASNRMAIKDFFTPLRCKLCFDKLNIYADLTLGDPHDIKSADHQYGETLIFVRTDTGKKLLQEARNSQALVLRETETDEALQGQHPERKRREWRQYMFQWKKMGHAVPIYPFTAGWIWRSKSKYRDKLTDSLHLDQYPSQEALFLSADGQYTNKKRLIMSDKKPLTIEIRKAGFGNKGAELMLLSILDKVPTTVPNAKFAMATNQMGTTPYEKRARLGLFQKVWYWKYGFHMGDLASLVPTRTRKRYGIVLDKEIDVVLDAAGFAYSDQWSIEETLELARACKRWENRGTKVVLLPQAFGPFSSPKIRDLMRQVINSADLIYARDSVSYQHLKSVTDEMEKIKIAPDFTILLKGVKPEWHDPKEHQFCIIPNRRMTDKIDPQSARRYQTIMSNIVNYLHKKQMKPFILIHEGKGDLELAKEIVRHAEKETPLFYEEDPLKIKGAIGACAGVIGSRFHGLVSALSQGIPSLAMGWSHKYHELFKDYDFPEGIIDLDAPDESIYQKIDNLSESIQRSSISQRLTRSSGSQKKLVEQMWEEVLHVIAK